MNVQIIIPIYYPDFKFEKLLEQIKKQTEKNISLMIIDSGSNGEYKKLLTGLNAEIIEINAENFNHGGTRQMGINKCPNKDIYIFLTQDAVLSDKFAIERLVAVFADTKIGCAYGRQLPHKNANVFAAFARKFNYPNASYVRSYEDRKKYGMKTAFLSNSFAAYRKEAMADVGGFPTNTILSEDMYVAAKMLKNGWDVAYVADACVYHSHNYTIWQEFKRYFDIGVFHAREKWIRGEFGKAEGEGNKFVVKEIKYLMENNHWKILEMIVRDGMKLFGYRLGVMEKNIPECIKVKISMSAIYWKSNK